MDGPDGLAIEPALARLHWTPDERFTDLTVAVSDPAGGRVEYVFGIQVIGRPDAPFITSSPVRVAHYPLTYFYDVEAYDPDQSPGRVRRTPGRCPDPGPVPPCPPMVIPTHVVRSVAALLLVACVADKPLLDPPRLADPTRADLGGEALTPIGVLDYGAEVRGEFIEDEQLDAYVFRAEAGAIITLDNSHLGSSRALDSTLFIYGPRAADSFYGSDAIAFDDDSGWGLHARLRDFEVPARGEYLAVLGTYAGLDRGRYRLTLTCESGSCEPPPPPASPSLVVDTERVQTGEDGASQTFVVRLSTEPVAPVEVWIESDDLGEGVVFPTRAFFCPAGFRLGNVRCEVIPEGEEIPAEPHWQREVRVRVSGVRDALADGDVPFEVGFRVFSDDPAYGELAPDPVAGLNTDATAPPDYAELEGLVDDALLNALFARTRDHQVFGYHGVNSARTLLFGTVDVRDGMLESLYSGAVIDSPGESIGTYMRGFNTEHSWPQGQFDRLDPMVSDLHHIYAVDITSNGLRSSYDYGFNTDPSNPRSTLGSTVAGTGQRVYQVRPERRGDVARAHFYMVARYAFDDTIGITFDDDDRLENGRIDDDEEAVLRQWSDEDPVDDWERARNDRIGALQGNRNPFVDRPDLVALVADF